MTTKTKTDKQPLADLLAAYKPYRRAVSICVDGGLLADLSDAVSAAEAAADAGRGRLLEVVDELRGKARAASVEFVQECIGAKAWQELAAAHQPSAQQRLAGMVFSPGFPPAAIAASLVEPRLSADEVEVLAERLPAGAWNALWACCLAVNVGDGAVI